MPLTVRGVTDVQVMRLGWAGPGLLILGYQKSSPRPRPAQTLR